MGGRFEVRFLSWLVQVFHAHTHTRTVLDKFNLERRLNNSATSTNSPDDHHRTNSTPRYTSPEACLKATDITGTMASTQPTNFGLATRTKRGSFSENNPNFESNLNTPNYVVGDGGLNAGTNSASDTDGGSSPSGGTMEQRVLFDSDRGSLHSVNQGMSISLDLALALK
jgi:hypothetical protein